MKAIVLEKAGGVENLIMKDIDKPVVKENEVLIETKSIRINPVDYKAGSTPSNSNIYQDIFLHHKITARYGKSSSSYVRSA